MTIEEARRIIATTNSPHLKKDMERFINNQRKRDRLRNREVSKHAERGASQQQS